MRKPERDRRVEVRSRKCVPSHETITPIASPFAIATPIRAGVVDRWLAATAAPAADEDQREGADELGDELAYEVPCRESARTGPGRQAPRSRECAARADSESVAVDAASSTRALGAARVAALPARAVLAGIVALSFAFRVAAGLAHPTPHYFPDEYIYRRSRALAEREARSAGAAHFPALLEPILPRRSGCPRPGDRLRLTQAALARDVARGRAGVPARPRLVSTKGFALASAALRSPAPN